MDTKGVRKLVGWQAFCVKFGKPLDQISADDVYKRYYHIDRGNLFDEIDKGANLASCKRHR